MYIRTVEKGAGRSGVGCLRNTRSEGSPGFPGCRHFSEINSTFGRFRRSSSSLALSHAPSRQGFGFFRQVKASQSLAASARAPRPALPVLSEQSAIPDKSNRPGLRDFPKVSGARLRAPPQIMLDPSFGSFRRFRSLTPPPRKTSVPSATASGRPHSRRRLRLFPSVLRLLPAPRTEKGGRMKTRWVKGRDTKKGRDPGSRHLPLRVGRVGRKERPISWKA